MIDARGVQGAVLDEEDVGAGGFGHIAAPVQHHGVGIAALFSCRLGHGADHVEAAGLGRRGGGGGVRATPFGPLQTDALLLDLGVEIAGPFPGGDGQVNLAVQRRDAELFGAQIGDGTDVAVRQAVLFTGFLAGGVDLGHAVGNVEVQQLGRAFQPLAVRRQLEDLAAVHTLTLEHRRAVVKAMGQNVRFRVPPGHERAVKPDPAVTIVERNEGH
ncbi:hypothetical protein D3C75_921090 [compost metagenome]